MDCFEYEYEYRDAEYEYEKMHEQSIEPKCSHSINAGTRRNLSRCYKNVFVDGILLAISEGS